MTPIGIATRNVVTFMGGFIGVPAMAVVVFEEQRDRLVDQTANLHTCIVAYLMNWWGCTHKNYILTNTVHFFEKVFPDYIIIIPDDVQKMSLHL